MASAISKTKNHIRLMNCLAQGCLKVSKALVVHYLPLAKPNDIKVQEWNMDEFLNVHRDGDIMQNFIKYDHQKKLLFPGLTKHTNINLWDLATLFTVLGLFESIDRDIKADLNYMRKMRNKVFHWGSNEMADGMFNAYKRKIEKFVDNCCEVTGDVSIKQEIKHILEDVERSELQEKALRAEIEIWKKKDILDRLANLDSAILDTLGELYMKYREIHQIKDQQMPVVNLQLDVKNCSKETSFKVTEVLYQNIRGSTAECDPENKEIKDAFDEATKTLLRGGRSIRETHKSCVLLTIQCPEFNSLKSLLEECLAGQLTATWNSVQNILRKQYKNEKLALEFTITKSEFWCCIEELLEILTTTLHEQFGVDISSHLSPSLSVHPPITRKDSDESGTGVPAVHITIKPISHRHAEVVSNMIKKSILNEDLRTISTLLGNVYGYPDVIITANLGPSETLSDEITNENTPVTEHGPSPPKKLKCIAATSAGHIINNPQSVTR